jgi:hypothetical protein
MEVIIAFAVLIIVIAGFDAAALSYGTDSRDPMPDDHRR